MDPDPEAWLERCTFLLRDESGVPLGTGILVAADHVLTCAHVVEDHGSVGIYRLAIDRDPLRSAEVVDVRDPAGADDLALLRLSQPLYDDPPLRFDHWRDGLEAFRVVGFPIEKDEHVERLSPKERDIVHGKVGGKEAKFDWLQLDAEGGRAIRAGFSGSAVWIPEREVAVGLVVYRDSDNVAYAIPTDQIMKSFPELFRAPVSAGTSLGAFATGPLPNIGDDRFVRILNQDKSFLGNGFRLTERWVVTAQEVGAAELEVRVEDLDGHRLRLHTASTVEAGDGLGGNGFGGIKLLETTATKRVPPFERWVSGPPATHARWRAVGHPSGAGERRDLAVLSGRLGQYAEGMWMLDLDGAPPDAEALRPWVGSGAFVGDGKDGWRLLGVLALAPAEADGLLAARTLDALRGWNGFAGGYARSGNASRKPAFLLKVARYLAPEDVRKALLEADDAQMWQHVAHDPRKMAEAACLGTDPDLLAEVLCRAHDATNDPDLAEAIFGVLMWSLPAALRHRWQMDLPEPSSTSVRLRVVHRVLIELAMASSNGRASEFRGRPDRNDTDFPRATHLVPPAGELGVDLEGEEAAGQLAGDLASRIALDLGEGVKDQAETKTFLAKLAATRHRESDSLFVGRDKLDTWDKLNLTHEAATNELIETVNRRLAKGTKAGGHLYTIFEPGQEHLRKGIERVLWNLRKVELAEKTERSEGFEDILDSLGEAFRQRTINARPRS